MNNSHYHLIASRVISEFLEQTVDSSAIQMLGSGYSDSKNFVCSTSNKELLIHCFPEKQSFKQREYEILAYQLSETHHLGPQLHYCDPNKEAIVTEFIHGKHPSFEDYHNIKMLSKMLTQLDLLHKTDASGLIASQTPLEKYQYSLDKAFKHGVSRPELNSLLNHVKQWQIAADYLGTSSCFVHDDVNPHNILITPSQDIMLIDWADAGIGSPFCDLAEIAVFFEPKQHQKIIEIYNPNIKNANTLLHYHWKLRLALFAAWGIECASQQDPRLTQNYIFQDKISEYQTLLRAILDKKQLLASAENFLIFSNAFYNAALKHLQK